MNDTAIIWTNQTWNPASGCAEVSEGCKFCYAKTLAENKRGTAAFPHGFDLTIRPHKLGEPSKLKTPSLIFVNSMSDLFWEEIPDEYRDKVLDEIERTPQHEYQVLTKRPENMLRYSKRRKFPHNFWAGVTVENERWLHRVEILREVEASIRFISAEPLLGPLSSLDLSGIHWLITGGESGSHLSKESVCERRALVRKINGRWIPREDRMDWVREIRDNCRAHCVKFLHKQWGGATSHSAGRTLDGRTWDEFPRLPQVIRPSYSTPIVERELQLSL
ncbi:MAG: phage Gp37/Gp68 family protein [Patescibacteria group bacterium]|nr:phage Gp37/Gp68 family protein [Patescibacteria group bacterium]